MISDLFYDKTRDTFHLIFIYYIKMSSVVNVILGSKEIAKTKREKSAQKSQLQYVPTKQTSHLTIL